MLLPGGAHFENLKKGDIVFNTQQTSELINSGRVMSGGGHARAYASGTTGPNLLNWDQTRTQAGKQSSSATDANTTATKNNTKQTNANTKAAKNAKKTWDWVEVRIKWWGDQVKKISDKITDYVDKATKQSLLMQQINKMNSQIKSNQKGAKAYLDKANEVAASYTYYNSDGTAIQTNVPKEYQKLVQKGTYRVEDMDTSTDNGKAMAEAIEQYQTWYNKYKECKQAVVDLKNEQMELFEQWANMPTEKAEAAIERLTAGYNGLNATQARLSAVQTGGSTQKAVVEATQEAATSSKATTTKSKKKMKTAATAKTKAVKAQKTATKNVNKKKKALLNTSGLTDEQKAAVNAGQKIDTTGMTGSQKKKADAYNKSVTTKTKADKKVKTTTQNYKSAKNAYISNKRVSDAMTANANKATDSYSETDELSYTNAMIDNNVVNLQNIADERDKAYQETSKNTAEYKKQNDRAQKKVSDYKKTKKKGKTIATTYSSKLTDAQKNALKAGKKVDLTGITDKALIKTLKQYNAAVTGLPGAINAAKEAKEKYNVAQKAEATAAEEAAKAETEAAQAVVQATQDKFDNIKNYYDARLSYQEQLNSAEEKEIDLSNAHGNYEKSSDYDTKITNVQNTKAIKMQEKDALEAQLQEGLDNGTIVEGSQEWIKMKTEILGVDNEIADCNTKVEELKQQQIGVYYEEQFDRAIDKIDQFKDRLDTLNGIISDDMKIDKNTGLLTEWGATSVMINRNQFAANQDELQTLINKQNDVKARYANGEDMSSEFGEKTYDEYIKDIQSKINNLITSNNSLQSEALSLVKNQAQAELDVLNKVISKRKEALSAKKEYYDYDKTLKNKTKDIQTLERQIAALEGSTNAEDKARKAKLQEQLSSAQEDLSDTITDHAYSMQSDALDKLSSDMSDDFEKWSNDISSNVEKMTEAINDAVTNSGMSNAQVLNNLSAILRNVGLTDEQIQGLQLDTIKGSYASGTDYVPSSGIYRVNENGMESVYSKQYGTLTFLNQGDKVFTADMTKKLIDNASIATQSSQPQFAQMYKDLMSAINNTTNQEYDHSVVYNIVVNEATDANTVSDIVVKKIDAYEKKRVRDFKGLR